MRSSFVDRILFAMSLQSRVSSVAFCVVAAIGAFTAPSARADDPLVGLWRASEDGGDGSSSIIELSIRDERMVGRIVRVVDAKGVETHPVCAKCKGPLEGRPLKGMEFITDLRREGDRWIDGHVIDLRSGFLQGTVVSCDLTLVDGKAVIRGYFVARILGGSSTWTRVADDASHR